MGAFHTFKTYNSFVKSIEEYPTGVIIGTQTIDLEKNKIYTIFEHMNKDSNEIFSDKKNTYLFNQSDLIVDYDYETNFNELINPITNSKLNGFLEEELLFSIITNDLNKKLIGLENKFPKVQVYFQDERDYYDPSTINKFLEGEIKKNEDFLRYS